MNSMRFSSLPTSDYDAEKANGGDSSGKLKPNTSAQRFLSTKKGRIVASAVGAVCFILLVRSWSSDGKGKERKYGVPKPNLSFIVDEKVANASTVSLFLSLHQIARADTILSGSF